MLRIVAMFMVCALHVMNLSRSMQQFPQEGWDLPRLFEHFQYSWWLFLSVPIGIYLVCTLIDALRAGLFRLLRVNELADALSRGLTFLWNVLLPLLQKGLDAWGGKETR